MFILFLLAIIIGAIFIVGSIYIMEDDYDNVPAGLIGLFFGVIILISGICGFNQESMKNSYNFQVQLQQEKFSQVKTVITGIEQNIVHTQAGNYYYNIQYSRVKSIYDYKIGQTVIISYATNDMNDYVIEMKLAD